MCFSLLVLTIFWQLVASFSWYAARAVHLCLSFSLLSYGCSLIETIPRKFQGFSECRFGGSEKECYYLKIPKLRHKLVWEYKWGKLALYSQDNAAKTCSYGLKISGNIASMSASMSFSLNHFFIIVTFSTQVASVPLNYYFNLVAQPYYGFTITRV